jgi:hypothetical protein
MELLDEISHVEFWYVWRQCKCHCTIGARFAQNVPQTHKSFWMLLVVHLGDEAQVEARFGSFVDIASLDARYVHGLRRTYHRFGNYFGHTLWYF